MSVLEVVINHRYVGVYHLVIQPRFLLQTAECAIGHRVNGPNSGNLASEVCLLVKDVVDAGELLNG